MAAIASFPDVLSATQGVYGEDITFECYATVLRGQAVQVHTGTGKIEPVPTTAATMPVGVALEDGVAGQLIPVRVSGIAYVANGDATTAIVAGVEVSVGTYAGAVIAAVTTSAGFALGRTLEPIAGGAVGRVFVNPHIISKGAQ